VKIIQMEALEHLKTFLGCTPEPSLERGKERGSKGGEREGMNREWEME
jgi:hypothetical protein